MVNNNACHTKQPPQVFFFNAQVQYYELLGGCKTKMTQSYDAFFSRHRLLNINKKVTMQVSNAK